MGQGLLRTRRRRPWAITTPLPGTVPVQAISPVLLPIALVRIWEAGCSH